MKFENLVEAIEINEGYELLMETIETDFDQLIEEGILDYAGMALNKFSTGVSIEDQKIKKEVLELLADAKTLYKSGNKDVSKKALLKAVTLVGDISNEKLKRDLKAELAIFSRDRPGKFTTALKTMKLRNPNVHDVEQTYPGQKKE